MVFKGVLERFDKILPEPKDVYEALEPLHVICQMIGLAPYKTLKNEDGTKSYQRSLWTMTRCILLFILYTVAIVTQVMNHDSLFGKPIQEQLQNLQDYFISLITLTCVSFGCIFAYKMVEVFKNIDEIDKAFQGLAVWMPYRRTLMIVTINVVTLILIAVTIATWVLILYPIETMSKVTLLELGAFLPFLLLGYLMESQYVHAINLLRHRYSLLNEYLEALARENKTYNGWVVDDKEEEEETNKISKSILKSVEVISDPILVIEKVASLHIKLSDTAMLINTSFSVQLLVRITIAFITIVTALYMIGVNFSNPGTDSEGFNVDITFTTWAASSALELMTVVWVTNATCEEANKCPRLMHKIRNATKNAKLQDVIEMYSLQMYHNRLQFYICGLFPLDYTLLHTIVAGVTTYLVILIQFNSANSSSLGSSKKPQEISASAAPNETVQ